MKSKSHDGGDSVDIESKWRDKWRDAGIFHADPDDREKIFLTVAYPYPSGAMHIGHGRTYTVPDVYARFKRMQGYNVLFPMAWHVTGAPVIGIARRIQRQDPWTLKIYREVHKVPEDELERFSDPEYIVEYFSREYRSVMEDMGYSIDWRREFKTTDPTYSRFIQWQIGKLREMGLVRKGAHPVKYCPDCENPVGDHDLLEGEGVAINQLTLLKFRMDDSYLVAATFRPETIYGATNLWLNPEEEYVRVRTGGEEWIVSRASLDNLSHQKLDLEVEGDVDPEELIGREVENPVTGEKHPVLPASFVDPEYATGVVFSVPAHAPADFIALEDLRKNSELLERYGLGDVIEGLEPINVITVEGYGVFPAAEVIQKFGVESQEDERLEDATGELYKIEHAKGVMSSHIPVYGGMKVSEAREVIADELKSEGLADEMYEFAERPVICRCGGRCVVRLMEDQWFMKYSDEEWKELAHRCLSSMKIIPEEVRANFQYYIDWLNDWACSRRIGLGTRLPWDERWIIEPLTDSTIYMAYYTIAHKLREMDPEKLDDEFFDNVFLGESIAGDELREEFSYWYPLDWRLSAKDLIGNHLTFHIFHHSAIFPESRWPRGVVVFGMGLLEGNKMSSSKGNVILLRDAIERHGADVVRLFLMSSAEPWQDFDWREKEVIGTRRRIEWFREFGERVSEIWDGKLALSELPEFEPESFAGKWMICQLNHRIREATDALESFQTRKAVQEALYLLKKDVDHYMARVDGRADMEVKMVLAHVLSAWIRLMAPFTPYTAEEMWERYGGDGFVSEAAWPGFREDAISREVQVAEEMVQNTVRDIQEIMKILDARPERVHLYISPPWKWDVLRIASEVGKPDMGAIMGSVSASGVHSNMKEVSEFVRRILRDAGKSEVVEVDEYSVLVDASDYIKSEVGADVVIHRDADYDPENKAKNAVPLKPAIYLET
ncbi:leucine--tRNA ligase [Methanothermobacter sp. THM-2]|uniref:leucine--tRNA ligase n=1 Tax=Methanothermobacter sp. THM-2 TaxID=2606912 RepID=UPI0013657FB5|nr:leucine--tRNA ligase [Methanothermobacter sp. THM-2]QHN07561.1 leucine--tRNA ligase [Methanothermobacter sp. THM-2]